MPVQLSSIANLLFPGLMEVTGKYKQIPRQYDKIFAFRRSNMALERTTEMAFLGLAKQKAEGAPTSFDNSAGQRFTYNQEHIELASGYAITRKAIDDNLYKAQFQPSNLGLMEAFVQTKEIYGANVLNTGNVPDPNVGGDGQPLFSTVHPVDTGSYANTPSVQADLNETSLLAGMISIRSQFLDQRGLRMFSRAKKLIIPSSLEPVAIRLLNTELRPGTANNDVNAIRSTAGGLAEGYMVDDYLTSPYAWFLLTNISGLNYMQRVDYETDMQVDFTTDNLLVKAYERFSFNYSNPRAAYGSFPTS
jgi:phage major head subunit gpT-like protein